MAVDKTRCGNNRGDGCDGIQSTWRTYRLDKRNRKVYKPKGINTDGTDLKLSMSVTTFCSHYLAATNRGIYLINTLTCAERNVEVWAGSEKIRDIPAFLPDQHPSRFRGIW